MLAMARKPRCILPNRLYEVTLTTFQSRYFFIPSKLLNALMIGVLAYCQLKYGLRICFAVFLSNHGHLLIRADSAQQVADFLCLSKSQIAKEVQRFCPWSGGIFAPNSAVTPITDEPEAQIERLRYLLSQGLKEGLVPHPSKWPGVHSAKALLTGSMRLMGTWIRRSDLYEVNRSRKRSRSRARRRNVDPKRYEETLYLELSPLPCWDQLEPAEIAKRTRRIVDELLVEHVDKRKRVRKDYRKRLTDRSMFCYRPENPPRGERPKVHAATIEEWHRWVDEYDSWVAIYRHASARLCRGILEAIEEFPEHAFVPTGLYARLSQGLPPPETVGSAS